MSSVSDHTGRTSNQPLPATVRRAHAPATPTLHEGFNIKHSAFRETIIVTPEGILEKRAWLDRGDVATFDRNVGALEYAVGYSFRGQAFAAPFTGDNRLEMTFAGGQAWPVPGQGGSTQLTIRSSLQQFNLTAGVLVLDDVVIE